VPRRNRDSSIRRWLSQRLSQWLERHDASESAVIMLTALVVGVGAGLGAVIFRRLIDGMRYLAYDGLGGLLKPIAPFHLLIIPAVGGLIVGWIIYRYAREARGSGVPEIMEAVALHGGRIRPRLIIFKALASSICIGSGGSAGREGPIAHIGSALGSTLGQVFNFSEERVRNLVACGTAGGIAATFNAPIAGSLFALEVVLGQFHATYFGAVVISAVTADVIGHFYEGDMRAFAVPEYTLVSPWELVLYTLLGAMAAVAAVGFTRLLYLSGELWETLRLPEYLKPALGGVLLGIVGILTFKADGFPRVFGVGYSSIGEALFGGLAFHVTLALFFTKMLATVLTLGSGGSGGVFAPSLFMGAMMGAAFGQVAHQLFPTITAPAGAYALVGMAAFFGGAAHAPVSAVLTLFEMTGNYRIILPLMLATVVSTLISRIINRESVYTLKLSRRGVRLRHGQDIDVMQGVTVGEVMTTDVEGVPLDMPLEELAAEFDRTHYRGLPVLNAAGELAGIVSIHDLEPAQTAGPISGKTVADIATTEGLLVAYPHEPMWRALRRLGGRNVSRLPVVEKEGSRRLVGVVRQSDIIRAYNYAIIKRARHQHKDKVLRLGELDGAGFMHITVPPGAAVAGRRISAIEWPEECRLISVHRGRELRVIHGHTVLQVGDRVTVFAEADYLPAVKRRLTGMLLAKGGGKRGQKTRHREFTIPAGAACSGRPVRDLSLPHDCILVSVRRDDEVIVPHGDTILRAGDVVEIFGLEDELSRVEKCLSE